MNFFRVRLLPGVAYFLLMTIVAGSSLAAQVSPEEVTNPRLKALETKYLQDMIGLNRLISAESYPYPFSLSRYVNVDFKNQSGMDTRGLEFVSFHDRTLLKFSGIYNAAFNSREVTRNQRAAQVFTDVVAPILRFFPQRFAGVTDFDAVGFEMSYHVTQGKKGSEYEGKENLVVVMPVDDALRFSQLTDGDAQQKSLNRSEVYISGERFGLALGGAAPIPVEELADSTSTVKRGQSSDASEGSASLPDSPAGNRNLNLTFGKATGRAPASAPTPAPLVANPPPTQAEVDGMQAKYQSALDAYGASVQTSLNQASPVAPSLAVFRNSLYLQLTLRNPQVFDKEKTSLYKRAALSFDTFLAPHLGDLVSHLPPAVQIAGVDVTVLVATSSNNSSSEAVEFVCPLPALRKFIAYEISNQELVEQSLVIVNGVRISLNLQQVE